MARQARGANPICHAIHSTHIARTSGLFYALSKASHLMKFQPIHRSRIVAALQDAGSMTAAELAEYLDLPKKVVCACIASTRWLLPQQVFRIVRYQPVTGRRGRDLSVFAAEAGADAPHYVNPKQRRKQAEARYRTKHRAVINARSRAKSTAPINPWLQLAAPEIRSAMSVNNRI